MTPPDGQTRRTIAQLRDQPPTVDQARAWLDNWTAVTTKISDLLSFDLAQAQPLLAALAADADILTAAAGRAVGAPPAVGIHSRLDAIVRHLDDLPATPAPAAGSTYAIDSSPATVDDPQMTVDPPNQHRHPRL